MKPIAIIGYGNLLREDDGIGRIAAERLAETLRDRHVKVYSCHQLGPELAETVAQASRVIFLECSTQGTPGDIAVRWITPETPPSPSTSRILDPAVLVAAARTFYDATPEAVVITVTGRDFDFGESFSPVARAALPLVIRRVISLLAPQGNGEAGEKQGIWAPERRLDSALPTPVTHPPAPEIDSSKDGSSVPTNSFSGGEVI